MELREENTYTFRVVFREGPQGAPMTIKQEVYNLIIGKYELSLRNVTSNEIIVEWPYHCIRRYGESPNYFSVELGRGSKAGEGIFVMETTKGKNIVRKINEMVKLNTDKSDPKTKTTPTGNVYTEHWPHTRKDETWGRGILELKSKLCHPPGEKTTTPGPKTADGPAIGNIGSGSEFTFRARSEPGAPPGLEIPSRSDTGIYLSPTFTDTTNEYVYDDGEALTTPGLGASDVLGEEKRGESTRIGHEDVSLENSTEHLRGQASARQVPGGVTVIDLPKKERRMQSRRDYENVKFLRK
ncbi:docking protein 3-like [Haliotis rubra]|uniref:docking protein 3-like n=1 Tax=Haliotis rubra TaxID=36100 RepID=UPI001EE54686|nr:docking protein 3-like [Haliotis rubra]